MYDTDYSTFGLGIFCLMAPGSWARRSENEPYGSSPAHLSLWCKYLLGWPKPDSIQKGHLEEIKELKIKSSTTLPWIGSLIRKGEYFLLEHRRKIGFDQSLPNEGLLIYHVNEV